jgi:hypothetical protein
MMMDICIYLCAVAFVVIVEAAYFVGKGRMEWKSQNVPEVEVFPKER